MKVIRKVDKVTNWNDIEDMIREGDLFPGDEIEIEGALWRVLDAKEREVLIWKHTGISSEEYVVFNEDGSNVYEGSDLQKYLREDYMTTIPARMQQLMSDDGLFPLSIEEVRQYLPTEGERIAVDEDGETVSYWLRSAYRGYASYTWYVSASGYAYTGTAATALRCAPACRLVI